MRAKTGLVWPIILALLATSCQLGATPSATPPSSPTADIAHRAATGVVLVALDGARPDWIAGNSQNGSMPNLAALAQRGAVAEYMQTVDPPLAATAYASLSTGAFPSRAGLVSDRYHASQESFHESNEQLQPALALSEPVWRTAMRNGLKTAVVFWPAGSLDVPDMHADYVFLTASSDMTSTQHEISFQEAKGWESPPQSFSPLREGVMRIVGREGGTAATLNVLAVDGTDDGTSNYDQLMLDDDKNLSNGYTRLPLGKWAAVTVSPRLHSGAYLCLTACGNVTGTVYASPAHYSQGSPDELLQAANTKLGFPPPGPDAAALQAGWISAQQYYEMAELRARWMTDVVLHVYRTYRPDLLLTTQSIIADCARAFLLVDERQPEYSPEKAQLYASYLQRAHKVADENLGRLLLLVNLADSAVFVLSGHGMMPVHTMVRLNTILKNAGLLQLRTRGGRDEVDDSKSKALAFASGGSAHIYINLQGRERPGLVAAEDYAKVQKQVIQALEETKGPDGQRVFARILKHEELKAVHLDAANSGDVFVQAAPGYYLSDELGFKKALVPAADRAAAGFDASLPEMHAVFFAAGDGLLPGKTIPPVQTADIAPTIARVLRFQPAGTLDGHAIEDIWR